MQRATVRARADCTHETPRKRAPRERELHVSYLIVNFALDLEAVAAAQRLTTICAPDLS